jgi:hypothetical protein
MKLAYRRSDVRKLVNLALKHGASERDKAKARKALHKYCRQKNLHFYCLQPLLFIEEKKPRFQGLYKKTKGQILDLLRKEKLIV